jgi:hypothetical protein
MEFGRTIPLIVGAWHIQIVPWRTGSEVRERVGARPTGAEPEALAEPKDSVARRDAAKQAAALAVLFRHGQSHPAIAPLAGSKTAA